MRAMIAGLLLAAPAGAAVEQATPTGFVIAETVTIRATPSAIWRTLVAPARWWSPQHSWSGDAANLSIDARPGGCFCETLPDGGGVEHLRVVYVAPGRQLRMTGALGPLQGEGVAGALTVTIAAPIGGRSAVTLRYSVGAQLPMAGDRMAPLVDHVLVEQLGRLKRAVEQGG